MSTTESGRKAEQAARVYLEMRGFTLLEQNWRRPRCEVDLIVKKDGVIHFVEVKYRKDDDQGGGFSAITASKLKQMQRSAWIYIEEEEWKGEYVLSAVEVGGKEYAIMGFIENAF
jgi:putative endonuclease